MSFFRLFLGVFPPPEIIASLPLLPPLAHFRPVSNENRHITLYFLGKLPQTQAEELIHSCSLGEFEFEPFSTRLTQLGVFPDKGPPRVLWIGVEPVEFWQNLHHQLGHRFSPWIPPTPSPYIPHLTLGRWKRPPHPRTLDLLKAHYPQKGDFQREWRVEKIDLIQSILLPQGPQYRTLATLTL